MSTNQTLSRRDFLSRMATLGMAVPTVALLASCRVPSAPVTDEESTASTGASLPADVAGDIALMIAADPVEETAYTTLLDAFHQAHEAIKVDLVSVPGATEMHRRLLLDFAAGTPADVFILNYRRYAAFADKNTLEPLAPWLAASSVIKLADFYPQVIDAFTWEEELFGIPQNIASLVTYYNKTIFDEAGLAYPADDWTWDDCVEIAKTLTQDKDGDGVVDVWGMGTDATMVRVAPFIWMSGGDVVDNPQKPTKLTLDTPEVRHALTWFIGLQVDHQIVPDPATELSESHETRFINGRLAMYLESRRVTSSLRLNTDFDWDIAPLPRRNSEGNSRATVLHSDAFCMAKVSKNKEAAWVLTEYANSNEGQTVLAQTGRIVPSRQTLAQTSVFLDPSAKPARSQVFLDSFAYLRNFPLMPTWLEIEAGVSRELEMAFHGDATLDAAIDGAFIRTKEFFKVT